MAGVTSAQWTGDNSPLMWALLLRAQKLAGPDLELEFPTAPPGVGLERGRWRLPLSRWSFSQVIDPIYSRRSACWLQNGDS